MCVMPCICCFQGNRQENQPIDAGRARADAQVS